MQSRTAAPPQKTGEAETKTENAENPPLPPDDNRNTLFTGATNLNPHLTALHATLPPCTPLLLFSGHSDPRSMFALAARRAEYQASQNQRQGTNRFGEVKLTGSGAVRWSTADDWALKEAVVRARMGLLFVGVKT